MAHLNFFPFTGRYRAQLRTLCMEYQCVRHLPVVETKIQKVELAFGHARIDDQQIEGLATILDQVQEFFEALHRRHPKIIELVEQPLDFHPVEVLWVSDQDA